MNVNVVTFDLDGTLVNTLPAIANAFNNILKKYGYETFTIDKYKDFIGNGFSVVFDKINDIYMIKEKKEYFLSEVRDFYNKNFLQGIYMYDGVAELLDYLVENGKIIAIITNKDSKATLEHLKTILSKWQFKYIFGNPEDNSYPAKPNPYAIEKILEDGYNRSEIVHIGDMLVDINMAKNANIKEIHCTYGYGKNIKHDISVDNARDIIGIIK